MAWVVLVVSGVLEAVWAVALGRSEGFSRLAPSLVFLAALAASMGGLAYAMRTLPIGTAYAVWVGIGASLTVAFGMVNIFSSPRFSDQGAISSPSLLPRSALRVPATRSSNSWRMAARLPSSAIGGNAIRSSSDCSSVSCPQ